MCCLRESIAIFVIFAVSRIFNYGYSLTSLQIWILPLLPKGSIMVEIQIYEELCHEQQ
jgi:hypothetical protein